jgi:hypothetical protein
MVGHRTGIRVQDRNALTKVRKMLVGRMQKDDPRPELISNPKLKPSPTVKRIRMVGPRRFTANLWLMLPS